MPRYKLTVCTKTGMGFEQLVELPDNAEQREAFLSSLKRTMAKDKWLSMHTNNEHMSVRAEAVSHFILTKIIEMPKLTPEAEAQLNAEINEQRTIDATSKVEEAQDNIPFPEKPKE